MRPYIGSVVLAKPLNLGSCDSIQDKMKIKMQPAILKFNHLSLLFTLSLYRLTINKFELNRFLFSMLRVI